MVGVCIVTYNQEQYIAQAIDSVLIQERCSETVRLYIGDDCSTDGTTSICREYASKHTGTIIHLVNSKNLGLVSNTVNVLRRMMDDGCDFIAMLDGDDYWCDNNKLEKQISFLLSNPEYGLVHTQIKQQFGKDSFVLQHRTVPPSGDVFQQMGTFSIANCSVLFRSCLLDTVDLDELESYGFLSLDYVMYAMFSSETKFHYLDDVTAVWRRDHISISNTKDEQKQISYLKNDMMMWKYLGTKFPEKFHFDEASWEKYYNYRVFNIAFKFKDYQLANSLAGSIRKPGLVFFLKRVCAKNPLLFALWHYLK